MAKMETDGLETAISWSWDGNLLAFKAILQEPDHVSINLREHGL